MPVTPYTFVITRKHICGNNLVIYLLDVLDNHKDINTTFIISANKEYTNVLMTTFKHFKTMNDKKKMVN